MLQTMPPEILQTVMSYLDSCDVLDCCKIARIFYVPAVSKLYSSVCYVNPFSMSTQFKEQGSRIYIRSSTSLRSLVKFVGFAWDMPSDVDIQPVVLDILALIGMSFTELQYAPLQWDTDTTSRFSAISVNMPIPQNKIFQSEGYDPPTLHHPDPQHRDSATST